MKGTRTLERAVIVLAQEMKVSIFFLRVKIVEFAGFTESIFIFVSKMIKTDIRMRSVRIFSLIGLMWMFMLGVNAQGGERSGSGESEGR